MKKEISEFKEENNSTIIVVDFNTLNLGRKTRKKIFLNWQIFS